MRISCKRRLSVENRRADREKCRREGILAKLCLGGLLRTASVGAGHFRRRFPTARKNADYCFALRFCGLKVPPRMTGFGAYRPWQSLAQECVRGISGRRSAAFNCSQMSELLGRMVRYLGTGDAGDTFGFPTSVGGVPSAALECRLSIVAYSSVVRMGFEM